MLLNFIAFIIILLLIDLIWLVGAGKLHQKTIEMVQKTKVKIDYIASILFYILASTAFIVFVYPLSTTIERAFLYGCLLGLSMYATFDLTNKAIFTNYTWSYAIADTLWGTFGIGVVSVIIYKLNLEKRDMIPS